MRCLLLCCLIASSLVVHSQEKCSDSLVYWSSRKLKWSDFPIRNGILENIRGEAISSCKVRASLIFDDSLATYEISTVFEKHNSWIIGIQEPELLNHEQLHFDIVELYARKIRKSIINKVTLGYSQEDVGKSIALLIAEISKIQDDYDKETLHGENMENQSKWEDEIERSLKEYEFYSSPVGIVPFR